MGALFSQDATEPPALLSEPWRTINWGDPNVLQRLKDYDRQDRLQVRALVYGPIGAGKSSFINSVQSALYGRISSMAMVENMSGRSCTREHVTYRIQKGAPHSFYPFVFTDMMGLESRRGVHMDDLKLAMKGHVKDGYKFNPESPLSENDDFYNRHPKTNDRVHVLVWVVPAPNINLMFPEMCQKIQDIKKTGGALGIPQVVILTKIDELDPEIRRDLKNVYRSHQLKEMMEMFNHHSNIPMSSIFPVKNYYGEISVNSDVDSLILSALTTIINYGDDYLNLRGSREDLVNFGVSSTKSRFQY
ncbi:uncharacterized protein V6R79_014268 [Siganus canaliculatus]